METHIAEMDKWLAMDGSVRIPLPLGPDASAELRDRLLAELSELGSGGRRRSGSTTVLATLHLSKKFAEFVVFAGRIRSPAPACATSSAYGPTCRVAGVRGPAKQTATLHRLTVEGKR